MSAAEMPSTRRRLSGMPPPAPPQPPAEAVEPPQARLAAVGAVAPTEGEPAGEPLDYGNTRMVSLRIPVSVHDRYRRLLAALEQSDPRLRRPGMTELIVQLLVEGPTTPETAGETIRRKRAAEHAA